MRNLNEDNATEAVIRQINAENPRVQQIVTSLIKHLHAFVREVELTEEDRAAGTVRIKEAVRAGQNVRRRGEDRREGDPVLSPGSPIGAPEVAALAALGRTGVRVHVAPTAAVSASSSSHRSASLTNSSAWRSTAGAGPGAGAT